MHNKQPKNNLKRNKEYLLKISIENSFAQNQIITTAIRKYYTRRNIKNSLPRQSKLKLQRLVKIEEYGTLDVLPRCVRGGAVTLAIENIKKHETLPTTRAISTKVNFSHVTVHNLMRKELNFKPYKIETCQVLTNLHKTKGVAFSEKFFSCVKNDKSFFDRVILSDEAYFTLSSLINKQYTPFWRDSKPSLIERKRFNEKVLVWTGFSRK